MPSIASFGHWLPSMAGFGHWAPSMASSGHWVPSMASIGHWVPQSMAGFDYFECEDNFGGVLLSASLVNAESAAVTEY